MAERITSSEQNRPSVVDRVRAGIDKVIHPVSSARAEQFQKIISVLPEGALKKSYQDMLPKLRDMLKIKDIDMLQAEVITRVFSAVWGGVVVGWGAIAYGVAGPMVGIPAIAIGSVAALGGALWPWGVIAHERKAIANETITYQEFYKTTAGKDAAKMWDNVPGGSTDQITRAIMSGTPVMRSMPGAVSPLPMVPRAGGLGS